MFPVVGDERQIVPPCRRCNPRVRRGNGATREAAYRSPLPRQRIVEWHDQIFVQALTQSGDPRFTPVVLECPSVEFCDGHEADDMTLAVQVPPILVLRESSFSRYETMLVSSRTLSIYSISRGGTGRRLSSRKSSNPSKSSAENVPLSSSKDRGMYPCSAANSSSDSGFQNRLPSSSVNSERSTTVISTSWPIIL